MTDQELEKEILDVLKYIQEESGREWNYDAEGPVIGTVPGFDSVNGIEATCMIEEKLGIEISPESIFVNEEGNQALKMPEIVNQIKKEVNAHG